MQIVDAQIHVWGSGLPINAAHRQVTRFDTDEVLGMMDAAGVAAAVINPPSWDPGAEDMALSAVRDHPGRFAIMGHVDASDTAGLERLKGWRPGPELIGIRYMFVRPEDGQQLTDGSMDAVWRLASDVGLPVAVLATPFLPELGRIAERFPDLKLTIDHLGGLGGFEARKDHAAMTHMPDLLRLSRHRNITVKLTGAPGYTAEDYPYPIMLDYCRRIIDAFGPERAFWGTDISKMPVSWTKCIEMFTAHADWLKGDDLELVMGKALCRAWNWERQRGLT